MPEVTRSIEIQAPPSAVWRWFATQEGLRRWLSPDIEIDLRAGSSYRMGGQDGETRISGTVLEVSRERVLVLSWLEEQAGWTHPARLVISLTASTRGTRVTPIHDGFAGIKPGWERTVEAYEGGADRHQILQRLAELAAAPSAQPTDAQPER